MKLIISKEGLKSCWGLVSHNYRQLNEKFEVFIYFICLLPLEKTPFCCNSIPFSKWRVVSVSIQIYFLLEGFVLDIALSLKLINDSELQ